jgi:type I restriction enzyme S subunit
LDTFTELTTELTNRKKQYNHYRDQLLSFEDGEGTTKNTKNTKGKKVEWKTLGEVAIFQNAKPHEKLVSIDGDIALLTAGYISSEGRSLRLVRRVDVLTPAFRNDVALVMSDLPNGKALAKTFFVQESDCFAANQRVCLLRVRDPEQYVPKFLHYVMNRNRQLLAYDSGYDQTHLKKDWILEVKIPVPPLAEQARIVAILDKFDTLTHSISEGLPREIELRQKQYEHYRNLLLSFPKPEEGTTKSTKSTK